MPVGGPAHVVTAQHAIVFVQGELAQSPRMINHARMLLADGWNVTLTGYADVALPSDLASHPRLSIRAIRTPATWRLSRLPQAVYLVIALVRAGVVAAASMTALWRAGAAHLYLVQNPPAVPALPIVLVAAALRRGRVVLDWHNTSASVLAFRLGSRHPLVRVLSSAERSCARFADAHLCVSAALQTELDERWGIRATVVHDRPRTLLTQIRGDERRAVRQQLLAALGASPLGAEDDPAVVAVPSSWSLEEDMPLLLDALETYAAFDRARSLIVIATGMGPGRAAFEQRTVAFARTRVRFVTGWLNEEAYWDLLRVTDAGVCMHRSTSQCDLPMKLLDFEAAGVTALAFDYAAVLQELPGACVLFQTADELACALHERTERADDLETVASRPGVMWCDEWHERALPVLAP